MALQGPEPKRPAGRVPGPVPAGRPDEHGLAGGAPLGTRARLHPRGPGHPVLGADKILLPGLGSHRMVQCYPVFADRVFAAADMSCRRFRWSQIRPEQQAPAAAAASLALWWLFQARSTPDGTIQAVWSALDGLVPSQKDSWRPPDQEVLRTARVLDEGAGSETADRTFSRTSTLLESLARPAVAYEPRREFFGEAEVEHRREQPAGGPRRQGFQDTHQYFQAEAQQREHQGPRELVEGPGRETGKAWTTRTRNACSTPLPRPPAAVPEPDGPARAAASFPRPLGGLGAAHAPLGAAGRSGKGPPPLARPCESRTTPPCRQRTEGSLAAVTCALHALKRLILRLLNLEDVLMLSPLEGDEREPQVGALSRAVRPPGPHGGGPRAPRGPRLAVWPAAALLRSPRLHWR